MSANQPRTSTSSRSNRDDVLQFLDSLDTYSSNPAPAPSSSSASAGLPRSTSTNSSLSQAQPPSTAGSTATTATGAPKNAQEAQSVLDFLDEITSSKPTTSTAPRASLDSQARRTPVSGMRTAGSRSNLSQVAGQGGSPGQSQGRKSTESVRSQQQRSTTPGASSTPSRTLPTTQTNQSPAPAAPSSSISSTQPPQTQPQAQSQPSTTAAGGGGWGWSSVWSTASTAITQASQLAQQARTVAEEQVKSNAIGEGLMKAWNHDDGTEGGEGGAAGGMKKWTEGVQGLVKGANLEGLGKELKPTTLKSLTDLLNAVAPPIAEHEVIQIHLSHSMKGYDGVESLVYKGLSKIMEQIEGGTLMVNRAENPEEEAGETEKKEVGNETEEEERDLNAVEGLEAGWKLAQDTLERLIASTYKPPSDKPHSSSSLTLPITTSPVYLRLQPVLSPLPSVPSSLSSGGPSSQLSFLLLLLDPTHSLTHYTSSQPLPSQWLDIPFEENEWVEEFMVDSIRGAVEVVGQEYITGRMRAQGEALEKAKEEVRKGLTKEENKVADEEGQEEEVSRLSQEARVGIV
ncbi:uncharacterized protein JCM6883_004164 [Sporobolomyces salmoneus]|uniref:uncharacterized protein n=1 Tax=Sporobolomyces salmoneus TaxID=183962 RepID=UPI003171C15E